MNKPIDFQIIHENGKPRFAVVPIEQFEELVAFADASPTVPNAVVRKVFDEGLSPVRAWREHLGLTQAEVADRLGVAQATFAQQESASANLRATSVKKIATAMGLVASQLDF